LNNQSCSGKRGAEIGLVGESTSLWLTSFPAQHGIFLNIDEQNPPEKPP
jgi:hypothetical protein